MELNQKILDRDEAMQDFENLEEFVKDLKYPKHCEGCEGIDERINNPRHHPSYEITPKCNLRCIFCYSRVKKVEPGYYGDWSPKVITISQFGEPFAAGSKEVARVIDALRERFGSVRIDIQTNGTFDMNILESRTDIIMISLSSGSREGYKKITGADMFDKVIKNIRKVSRFAYTVVRTVYLPGINDTELESVARIVSEMADEMFLQPLSVYRENIGMLKDLDMERNDRLYDFLKKTYELSEIADVRVPGCMLFNLRNLLKKHNFDFVKSLYRDPFGSIPLIRRERLFVL